jgi:hypothetical protein
VVVVIAALTLVVILERTIFFWDFHRLNYILKKAPLYFAGSIAGYWFVERVLVIIV